MKNFKKLSVSIFSVFLLATQFNFLFAQEKIPLDQIDGFSKTDLNLLNITEKNYVEGEVLVKFKPSKINLKTSGGKISAQTFADNKNMGNIDSIVNSNVALLQIEGTETVEQKIIQLQSDINVEYAQPNYIYKTMATSFNDPYSGYLRALPKIHRYESYEMFSGNVNTTGTIVAVIDAGVAYSHPDLSANMRNGSSCKDYAGNQLNNCIHGYDFADNDNDPYPVRSDHGTHVAGTIAAAANNGFGIMGINPHAQIMAIRVGDNTMTTEAIVKGIDFARYNNAKIINASFGGSSSDQLMSDAINNFGMSGGLFITAAGNSSINNDIVMHFYPCDYSFDNIICVAATTTGDNLASFSNYGTGSVDLGAPGENIYSTLANIATTTGMFEDFESTSTGTIPSGRSTGGNGNNIWGALDIGGSRGVVLYGDMVYPYANNVNSFITKSINTTNTSGITIDFRAMCDTQYSISSWNDYMSLEASADGLNFAEIGRWDEAYLDDDQIEGNNTAGVTYSHLIYDLTGTYINSNFAFRFKRVTDASNNNYNGCLIDDLYIKKYSPGANQETYGFKDGTSMASPHVAGLASLTWSASPSLTYSQIRSIIINSGDSISSLSGKTVSGKRINSQNVLTALGYSISVYSGPNRSQIYTAISQTLSGRGIQNNLNLVTTGNVSSFSGLYFAKMSGENELGRIIFVTGLDLTDTGTQNFLSGSLPTSIGMSQGQVWFNAGTGFIGKNATLKMNLPAYFSGTLQTMNANNFVVREGSGLAITGNGIITSVTPGICVGSGNFACSININVAHFTQFDIKPFLSFVHIYSNTGTSVLSGDMVYLSFTGSELLTGVSVSINGQSSTITGQGLNRTASRILTGLGTGGLQITFSINFYDMFGNSGYTTISTTDGSSLIWGATDVIPPTANIIYSTTGSTNQNVTATITGFSEAITGLNASNYMFTGNGSFAFTFSDLAGNTGTATATVTWIDKVIPIATITYSPNSGAVTSGNVATIITFNKTGVTVTNNGGSTGYIFTGNGNFLFTFSDLAGNTGTATATVTWIDKTILTGTIIYSTTGWTNQNVTTYITFNKTGVTVTNNGGSTGYIFTGNGSFIFTFTDSLGNTGMATATVALIDKIIPSITVTSSNIAYSGTITLQGTGSDNNGISQIYVNGYLATGTGYRSKSISLVGGTNAINISGIDLAGNITGIIFNITRLPVISGVISQILSGTASKISFNSDFVASGYVVYGISSLDSVAGGVSSSAHSIVLNGLMHNTKYYYKAYAMINGVTGTISSTGSFTLPYIIPTNGLSGVTTTGTVDLGGGTNTTFTTSGNLRLYGSGSTTDYFEINLSGLSVLSDSGSWNGLIFGPVQTGFIGTIPTETSYTHQASLTFKIGGEGVEITLSGEMATVKIYVGTSYSGKVLRVFRSTNGTTYTKIDSCTVSSIGYCSFETDKFSYFTMMSPSSSAGGGGGAGGGGTTIPICKLSDLVCINGEYAIHGNIDCEGGSLGATCQQNNTGSSPGTGGGSIVGSRFGAELNNAYLYAYRIGITTMPTIQKANMTGTLQRAHLAKMIVNYAYNVLNKQADTSKTCSFNDTTGQSIEMKGYIKLACQMGLMGVGIKSFYPTNRVTRAEFGTILSRALWGNDNDQSGRNYYSKHLQALKESGIMSQITNAGTLIELRGYVMLMMQRAENK